MIDQNNGRVIFEYQIKVGTDGRKNSWGAHKHDGEFYSFQVVFFQLVIFFEWTTSLNTSKSVFSRLLNEKLFDLDTQKNWKTKQN